ncbi:MAG: PhoH family protein, partial [Daejeonella sp.]|nr:PhoH family protein [Daejeonella sp.]
MNELNLSIENIDPVVIWGANNEYFEIFKKHFPKIKIVARGNEVKVLGDDRELNLFSQKFQEIINHVDKFQTLTVSNLEQLLGTSIQVISDSENAAAKSGAGAEAIVFGPNGIVVKARTANQRKMVGSINKNDIIFAIGPAGT